VSKKLWRIGSAGLLAGLLMAAVVAPAAAKEASPPVSTRAWYWEQAESNEFTDPAGNKYTIETPNPFCPSAPGSLGAVPGACAEGRLPIEIQGGDYETPNKISAVNFDLTLVPIGSKVTKFTATFLEAESGCYDGRDEDQQPASSPSDWCEQTDPVNIEGKELQACVVQQFFGDGDARPYKEAPRYKCSSGDPTAKRKEIKAKGDQEPQHAWTFDLTEFAQDWIKAFTTNTSIMIVGKPPKGYKPDDNDGQDNWRVVLMGAKAPGGKEGVKTKIVFDPAEFDIAIPPPTGTTTGGVATGTTTTSSGGVETSTVSTGGDFGGDTGGGTFDAGGAPATDVASPAAPAAPGGVLGAEQTPKPMPAYVWLALAAGILGWMLFRSVILERAKGIRPDGVLAQIHQLSSASRGASAAAAGEASPLGSFFKNVKHAGGSVISKLTRKG
jgi:hypothetical protein